MGFPSVVSALNLMLNIGYVSTTAWYLEFAYLKRPKYNSLLPPKSAKKVKLSWNFRVS